MKKCILSALAGALAMLIVITIVARISAAQEQTPKEYEHIDYVSNITQEECFVCGTNNGCPIRFNGLPVSDERCGQFG